MASSRQNVWLITGASSSLGYRLCLSALARGDLVIASAPSKQGVDRLCSAGAYGIKMDSEMSFAQIRSKIREAVSRYGRIDFLINHSEFEPQRHSSAYDLPGFYESNTFSYAAIQVTKAVSQESTVRQIAVVVPVDLSGHLHQNTHEMSDNVEATAQLLASEYRYRRAKVLLVKPGGIVPATGSRHAVGDARVVAGRIITNMVEGGASEPGIRVL